MEDKCQGWVGSLVGGHADSEVRDCDSEATLTAVTSIARAGIKLPALN